MSKSLNVCCHIPAVCLCFNIYLKAFRTKEWSPCVCVIGCITPPDLTAPLCVFVFKNVLFLDLFNAQIHNSNIII